jgi:hypothetical protein
MTNVIKVTTPDGGRVLIGIRTVSKMEAFVPKKDAVAHAPVAITHVPGTLPAAVPPAVPRSTITFMDGKATLDVLETLEALYSMAG